MSEQLLTNENASKLLKDIFKPRFRTVPLDQDEIDLMNELLDRHLDSFETMEIVDISTEEHRRYRLGFVYILSRNTENFNITQEWLRWIWSGKKE